MKRLPALLLAAVAAGGALVWAQLARAGGSGKQGPSVVHPQIPVSKESERWRQERIRRNEEYGMNGVIRGRIRFEDGTPAVGFPVRARFKMHQTGAPGEGDAVTDGKGEYEIRGLGSDEFWVEAGNAGKPYLLPTPVLVDLVKLNRKTVPDFVLRLGPEVTVQVKDAETGKPVPNLKIKVDSIIGLPAEGTTTDAKGEARFRVGLLEFYLNIEDTHDRDGYGQAPGYPMGRQIKLTRVEPVRWETLVYRNWAANEPATFKGIVVDDQGRAVPGAKVRMQRYNDSLTTTSDAQGKFAFKTFRIQNHEDPARGAAVMVEKGEARAFRVVSAKETWGTIRMVLGTESRALVKGRVVDQNGKPLPACRIHYWETFGISVGSVQPSPTQYTNQDGTFVLRELHPGASYSFAFGTFYDGNKPTGVAKLPREGVYSLTAKGLDFGTIVVPTADRVIQGTIVDTEGKPVTKDVSLQLRGKYTFTYAYPDAAGRFEFTSVVDEPTTLYVFVGKDGFYRSAPDSPDLLLKKEVGQEEKRLSLRVKMRSAKD